MLLKNAATCSQYWECKISGIGGLFPVSVRDSRIKSDYAMVLAVGTSSGGYLTLAIHRATVALVQNARHWEALRLFHLRSKKDRVLPASLVGLAKVLQRWFRPLRLFLVWWSIVWSAQVDGGICKLSKEWTKVGWAPTIVCINGVRLIFVARVVGLVYESRLTVVKFCEWQCMAVVTNGSELSVFSLTLYEESYTVLCFALS